MMDEEMPAFTKMVFFVNPPVETVTGSTGR